MSEYPKIQRLSEREDIARLEFLDGRQVWLRFDDEEQATRGLGTLVFRVANKTVPLSRPQCDRFWKKRADGIMKVAYAWKTHPGKKGRKR